MGLMKEEQIYILNIKQSFMNFLGLRIAVNKVEINNNHSLAQITDGFVCI